MDVLFCHGLESAPHGAKYHALADAGLQVIAPDCREKDLAERVKLLADAIAEFHPLVVVGSSYGGIAGLLAARVAEQRGDEIEGLLMCAPALALPDPPDLGVRCSIMTRRPEHHTQSALAIVMGGLEQDRRLAGIHRAVGEIEFGHGAAR